MAARAHRSEVAGDSDRSPDYVSGCNHSGPGRCEAGDGRTIAAGRVVQLGWAGEPRAGVVRVGRAAPLWAGRRGRQPGPAGEQVAEHSEGVLAILAGGGQVLSLIHISEPTRLGMIS